MQEPGMVTTDEPGVYIEGSHGIRTENELALPQAGGERIRPVPRL
ncbi:MAG: hypothetical protein ACLUHE_03530 [Christensenellales bacterium]